MSVNLARIPDDWSWNWKNVFFDYTVRRSSLPSIRIEPNTVDPSNESREVYCCVPVNPGDHVVAKVYIKVDAGTPQDFSGARIGLDIKTSDFHTLLATVCDGQLFLPPAKVPDDLTKREYVHWGAGGWVERTIDVVIPAGLAAGSLCLWLQVWNSYGLAGAEQKVAWFADTELYINPEAPPKFACPFCDYEFSTENELAVHIRSAHPEVNPPIFECPWCELNFNSEAELAMHIRATHPEERRCFIATACGTNNICLGTLRGFRDRCLPALVTRCYYRFAPHLARAISPYRSVKKVGRLCWEWVAGWIGRNLEV